VRTSSGRLHLASGSASGPHTRSRRARSQTATGSLGGRASQLPSSLQSTTLSTHTNTHDGGSHRASTQQQPPPTNIESPYSRIRASTPAGSALPSARLLGNRSMRATARSRCGNEWVAQYRNNTRALMCLRQCNNCTRQRKKDIADRGSRAESHTATKTASIDSAQGNAITTQACAG